MESEATLIQQARQGDPKAFGQLYELYADRVYRYLACRVHDAVEAEDLTAETFVRAVEAVRGYRWQGVPFGAWLFRIAHNVLVDHWRRAARHKTVALEEAHAPVARTTADHIQQALTREELAWGLRQLTELQQEVITLRFVVGLSIAETAQAMQRSEPAVKDLQHKALIALRKHLAAE